VDIFQAHNIDFIDDKKSWLAVEEGFDGVEKFALKEKVLVMAIP
jgi:hypothetical protein